MRLVQRRSRKVGTWLVVLAATLGQFFLSARISGDLTGIREERFFTPPLAVTSRISSSGSAAVARYHELEEEILRRLTLSNQSYIVSNAYNKATIVNNATSWFKPKKMCKDTCCVENVAISLDQDNRELISHCSALDLADVFLYLKHDIYPRDLTYHGSHLDKSLLPCFQPGTILSILNGSSQRNTFSKIRKQIKVPYILFTTKTDSNSPSNKTARFMRDDEADVILKWYGTNPKIDQPDLQDPHNKFEGFPLGLAQTLPQGKYLEPFLQLTNYSNPFLDKDRWLSRKDEITVDDIFVKFGVNSNSLHRQAVFDTLCRHQTETHGISCTVNKSTPSSIYAAASRYLFAVSPPGNGWDCYRTYEWLLLGVIPIIEYRESAPKLFEGLPVVFIPHMVDKSMTKDTKTASLDKYINAARSFIASDDFRSNTFNGWNKLFLRYWRRRVLQEAGRSLLYDESGLEFYEAFKYTSTKF